MKIDIAMQKVLLYGLFITGFGLFFSVVIFSQVLPPVEKQVKEGEITENTTPGSTTLPTGYKNYNFGDSIETIRSSLDKDTMFLYEGEPDVTMIEPPDRTTIGVAGREMLENGFFVFYQEKLYEIILEVNPEYLDYFALYMQLYKKYGEPKELNPQRVLWESDNTILTLERSLFVKYLDKKTFEEVTEKMELRKGEEAQTRDEFLNEL